MPCSKTHQKKKLASRVLLQARSTRKDAKLVYCGRRGWEGRSDQDPLHILWHTLSERHTLHFMPLCPTYVLDFSYPGSPGEPLPLPHTSPSHSALNTLPHPLCPQYIAPPTLPSTHCPTHFALNTLLLPL